MTADPSIVVDGVGKRFRLRSGGGRTLKEWALSVLRGRRGGPREFWALDDITFSVNRGETLGLIGANGAGKSTLLSLLAGTKTPTRGTIRTVGTISSLLELGAGFHPDLTGRDNVYLSGAIMGLTRAQMRKRFDAIVEFSGIGEFIDQPVKHYSSGMYVRLGFSVAVEVDPDILLIDEVLAVGDMDFQRKCLAKIGEFRERGKTMLLISHDLGTIQRISDRIMLLDQGRLLGIGSPDDVLGRYRSLSRKRTSAGLEREWGTGDVRIVNVEFRDASGAVAEAVPFGGSLSVRIAYEAAERVEDPVFGFSIADAEGRVVYGTNTQIEQYRITAVEGAGALELRLDGIDFSRGTYLFSFSVHSADHRVNYHRLDHCYPIDVETESRFEGVTRIPVTWRLVNE